MGRRPVLVIGGGGLVGRHVAEALPGPDTIVTYHREPIRDALPLDVTDDAATTALIRKTAPSAIVLAAAEPSVERCETEPGVTRRINVESARPIAAAARAIDALLAVFSSEYVFDGVLGEYDESAPVHPVNEYGRQKVELEEIARSVPRHLVCRTSGVFGWEPARKNFVCQLVDRLRRAEEFRVPADQLITPTYAVDLARIVVALIQRGENGTVHAVGPEITTRVAFAEKVCHAFGLDGHRIVPTRTADLGLKAARPERAGLCDRELRLRLGASMPPLTEALARMRSSERR